MEKYTADGAPQIAYPIISRWVSQGLGGSFVEDVIMAGSAIMVISKKLPFGLTAPALRPNVVEIRERC